MKRLNSPLNEIKKLFATVIFGPMEAKESCTLQVKFYTDQIKNFFVIEF